MLTCWQDTWVADGVTAWPWLHVLAVERLLERAQLVVLHNLLQAELQVAEQRDELVAVGLGKLTALRRSSSSSLCEQLPNLCMMTCSRCCISSWSSNKEKPA